MSTAKLEIQLRVDFSGDEPAYERVPAEELGPNRFRIIASPGFAPGVASGDEIALDPSARIGYRMLRRSGNVCIQLFMDRCSDEERVLMTDLVRSISGWLDGGMNSAAPSECCMLIFTVPLTAGFHAIERTMAEIATRFAVERWMYGNVYDPSDNRTPLNWWNDK
jgi:hypothetical protein